MKEDQYLFCIQLQNDKFEYFSSRTTFKATKCTIEDWNDHWVSFFYYLINKNLFCIEASLSLLIGAFLLKWFLIYFASLFFLFFAK
jgi:hypothetical protein